MTTLYALNAVTVAGYRVHTGDQTSAASAVSGALVEAEELLAEELRRGLAYQARTGTFNIYRDGHIYPDAWPIFSNTGNLVIEGRALLGATPDVTTFIGYFPDSPPNRATVTWTGGFDDGSANSGANKLPTTLRNAIYDLAHTIVGASSFSLVPAGALSASVGDASITFGSSSTSGSVDALVPGLWARVARYRNRWV